MLTTTDASGWRLKVQIFLKEKKKLWLFNQVQQNDTYNLGYCDEGG